MSDLVETHGDIVRLTVAGKRLTIVADPTAVETILIDENEHFEKGGFQKRVTASLLGQGLVLAEGEQWREHRHALEPAFHPRQTERFADVIQGQAARQFERWTDGDVLDFDSEMQELTLAIISEALFDVDTRSASLNLEESFAQVLAHYEQVGETYIYVPEWIPTPGNRRYKRALDELNSVVERIIQSHARGDGNKETVVSKLLTHGGSDAAFGRDEIRDEIVTMLVAGHETTALALTFTIHLLGTTPSVLQRTRAEVDSFDDDQFLEQVRNSQWLERVIDESLRLYPPAYSIFREPTTDVTLGGYRIPEGTIVVLPQWVVHRDETVFDSPSEFRPSRWTDEFRSSLSPGSYFPFAAGPRRCIGERFAKLELKIVLGMFLREFDFEIVSEAPLDVTPSLSTRPADTVTVSVQKRSAREGTER
ncbi:cytochrome P450 [Haloferax mucosum ATCC BAA-1512]|uniref:Cytochrome P450 n=2 Tax=Haloferax mucosum TaxID=403181 RepID=M0IIL0_9EURY|nr:cytochrome P450 [Haloferax mucosum ATCC BAA-1512]